MLKYLPIMVNFQNKEIFKNNNIVEEENKHLKIEDQTVSGRENKRR